MCRHCSADPSFRGFDLRMANARLGWFSPLGVAASIRASARRVGLRAHCFRFSARTDPEWPFGGLVLPPSASEIALGELAFGLTASAFRHAPLRSCRSVGWFFRFPLRRLPLGGLAFGLTVSAFRHAPLRGCCSAGWPSGSRLPLFGMRRSAPPHRRREDRRSTPTRHLFHFKTLISTC